MSTASIRDVLFDLAPSFETVDVTALARIDRFIERATVHVNEGDDWAGYDEAVALLALHYLELRNLDANGDAGHGVLTAEKTDNASVSYANGSDSRHGSTQWGSRFDELMAGRIDVGDGWVI